MINKDAREQGAKETKINLNVKVNPDMMLGITSLFDERHIGGKYVLA